MKRRINSLISVLMITIFLATSIIPSITANADTRTKLATPTNVRWIDGTTATLAWDAVPNAHHYSMEIYKEDGSLSGSASTIDASTSLDMVQSISLAENYFGDLNGQNIYVKVKAVVDSSNENMYLRYMDSDYSSNSPLLRYVRPMVIECDNGLHVVPTEAMYTALRNSLSAEQLATSDGKQLEFDFDVTEMAAGGAGTDDISTYANNHDYTIGKFFDLTLIVKADGVPIGTITATAAAIPISVDVPATLQKAGRTFIVLKNHNGDISEVGRGTGTSVPISTDSFSTYAIAYSDNIAAPVNPANPTSSNNGSGIIGNAFDLLALYSQSPSSSSTTGHIHNYVWKTDANGNMYYVCTSCGDIAGEKLVPSGYAQFQKDTTEKIKAATGNTVTIKTDIWISFHKSVIEELAQHPELSLTIEYRRDGKRYSTTIPAGYDVRSLLNDEGYVGFLYLNTKFGRTELN